VHPPAALAETPQVTRHGGSAVAVPVAAAEAGGLVTVEEVPWALAATAKAKRVARVLNCIVDFGGFVKWFCTKIFSGPFWFLYFGVGLDYVI
jgi:hypothetical protein